ncbi:ATP-binding cassette domain-containing protein [Sanguibacter hominis ATCC BAA-789]|uniref:ATP-binding cassette domain-containing protein n=1 Tax=Sanguibacter hominis ATCC BAA-789 TaxID=1312740 RepID=A0A9X5IRA8_9MICO|nr:ATP-binding cassette domain-containing protein [Sanguibacter hominis]NKX92824.1 ATP-binding cassette domain-containing protein [Sanguibacter hominis ATCC BAA-789]
MTAPVLTGTRLAKSFGATSALVDASIDVAPGEIVAVMGPSGSGKSTLLHLLAGLLRPDAGTVEIAGVRIDTMSERQRSDVRLRQLGFVFQHGELVPELTVVENVELPLRLTGVSARPARDRALEALDRLGVAGEADRRLSEVSGGQAQRAAVARALVHAPPVVLADEPTGALDTLTGELVLEAFVDAARDQGTAVVLVTHDLRVASYASRDVLVRDGRSVDQAAYIGDPR